MGRLKRGTSAVLDFLDLSVTLAVAVAVTALNYFGSISIFQLQTAILAVTGLLSLNLARDRLRQGQVDARIDTVLAGLKRESRDNDILEDAQRMGLTRILDGVSNYNWLDEIQGCKVVRIAKIKSGMTQSPEFFRTLENILSNGGQVTILVADPRAPATLQRYFDEPVPFNASRAVPTSRNTLWVNGLEEIAGEIHNLSQWADGLRDRGVPDTSLRLLLGTTYPTHAYLQFDNRLFVYQYPVLSRGFHAPCLVFTDVRSQAYKYHVECMHAVLSAGVPMREHYASIWNECRTGRYADSLIERLSLRAVEE